MWLRSPFRGECSIGSLSAGMLFFALIRAGTSLDGGELQVQTRHFRLKVADLHQDLFFVRWTTLTVNTILMMSNHTGGVLSAETLRIIAGSL
jgi:hypothetical protein